MRNNPKKILCIANCLLGNRTFTTNLQTVLNCLENVQVDYILVELKDYSDYPVPKWKKIIGMTAEILHIINQKLINTDFSKYDLVVAQGFEIGWAINARVRNIPCIMFNDATPTATHKMMYKYPFHNWFWKLRSLMLIWIYRIFFRNVFSNIDRFFPRTDWCGQSLIRDFKVDSVKVERGTAAIDLNKWKQTNGLKDIVELKLLFIGNDFKRKGGEFLLRLYSRLSGKVKLMIISNDDYLHSVDLPKEIELLSNIPYSDLPKRFYQADLFIFPTYKEHLGLSQIEALASGLPIISRDVGGVSDVVVDGYNGFLMPYNSKEEQWIEKILYLSDHPEDRRRMGSNSRKLAEEKYSMEKFKNTIHQTINKLLIDGK